MKKQFFLNGSVILLFGSLVMAQETVDFRFSPPEWQTSICLPDDPHKTLVDRSGELLYHYNQGGREFGTRIHVRIAEDAAWMGQELYSPRVPLVKTLRKAKGLEITEEAFADYHYRDRKKTEPALKRMDDGGFLQNWAKPEEGLDPSLKDIAVHFNGLIHYEYKLQAGSAAKVALVLCEGYWSVVGKRIQILSVEGAKNKMVDVVADIGSNKAGVFWFQAKDVNRDGRIRITIEPAKEATDKNTILNGLWIFKPDFVAQDQDLLTGKLNAEALADITHLVSEGPARADYLLVQVKNTGKETRTIHPVLMVNTALSHTFSEEGQEVLIQNQDRVRSSLPLLDFSENTEEGTVLKMEELSIPAGQTRIFHVEYTNASDSEDALAPVKTAAQLKTIREGLVKYWEQEAQLPFDRVLVPEPGIQALLESSVRNIWQARELKKGLPVFQVGPTCYRGLWIVDGAFLLEAATLLGAGDQARNGVAYELSLQKADGRMESLAPDFWKENGIVLWTCVRHAQLTQDPAWLESVWPKLQGMAQYIVTLRKQTYQNESLLDDGLQPAGTLDGGIGGTHDEYTNTVWNLTGLKAFIAAAHWLGKTDEANSWQKEYTDFYAVFEKAIDRDGSRDPFGNFYLPSLMGEAGLEQLPQRAQWAFCQAVYPGQIFEASDPLVSGTLAMLEATEKEGMVYGTGWDATGIWNYFASFYGHAWLWQGRGRKAAEALYAFGNHAAPTLVWREEQSLKGQKFKKVGDMPHNWASAEFIRLVVHLLALDRGQELHLFEGLPREWTQAGMRTRLKEVATPFGPLSLELVVAEDGKSAKLRVEPLADPSCESIVLHLDGWSGAADGSFIRLDPRQKNEQIISIQR